MSASGSIFVGILNCVVTWSGYVRMFEVLTNEQKYCDLLHELVGKIHHLPVTCSGLVCMFKFYGLVRYVCSNFMYSIWFLNC